jgi:hypothetical protein
MTLHPHDPKLSARDGNGRAAYVEPLRRSDDEPPAELPWYSILRVNLSSLATLLTLLLAMAGIYFKVQQHDRDISDVRASMKSKESADGDMKLVLSKLDDLRERLDRMERQQQSDRRTP